MDAERYARVSELFQAAIEVPKGQRATFLAEACGADDELRAAVEELLVHDQPTGDLFDEEQLRRNRFAVEDLGEHVSGSSDDASLPDEHPARIGPYTVLEPIGAGGMGRVYRCLQEKPIRREVAVKLIKLGMDSAQMLRRFELEREALERMTHPHIALVLDAGLTSDGRPYFAMEYVRGSSILEYCDERQLGLEARLSIFVAVARAIQHAHQRGILHRDIKPSNVLVTEVDGTAVPKVIDFGLARALDPEPGVQHSRAGQILGTPAYMSPEQADPEEVQDVDSRSDVYSLGVLLYELLTGSLPFEDGRRTTPTDRHERPSSRFSGTDASSQDLARRRSTSLRGLYRALRGDLDWIVLMAMDPERARRYPTASELAADVERYLQRQPVLAGPPSAAYRLRKFYQRQRALAWGGTAFVVVLIAGLVTMTELYQRAAEAETRAVDLLEEVRAQNDIFQHMLVTPDPRNLGPDARVVDLLQRGIDYTLEKYVDQPRTAATVLQSIGITLRELGQWDRARDCLERAVELRRGREDATLPEQSNAVNALALWFRQTGDYEQAQAYYRQALELSQRIPNPDAADMRSQAATLFNLGRMLTALRRLDEAEHYLQRAVELQRTWSPDDDEVQAYGHGGLAELLSEKGEYEAALEHARAGLEHARRAFRDEHPHLATSLYLVGSCLTNLGKYAEAEPLLVRALEIARRAYPPMSPNVRRFLDPLIEHYLNAERYTDASDLIADGLEIADANFPPGSLDHAMSLRQRGRLRLERGRLEDALDDLNAAHDIVLSATGPEGRVMTSIAELIREAERRLATER